MVSVRGVGSGEGWRSPAGISALAAVAGTLVALVALLVSFAGDEPDGEAREGPASGSAGGPSSGSVTQSAAESASPVEEPVAVELPAVTRVEQIVPGVHDIAVDVLPSEEAAGDVERRGTQEVNADFPVAWPDGGPAPWLADESDDRLGLAIPASTDVSRFFDGEVAGFFVGASSLPGMDPEKYLEARERGWETNCVRVGENTIEGGAGSGHYEVYRDCGPSGSMIVEVATKGDYSLYVHARLTDVAHLDYLQALLESLDVSPPVPTAARPGDAVAP